MTVQVLRRPEFARATTHRSKGGAGSAVAVSLRRIPLAAAGALVALFSLLPVGLFLLAAWPAYLLFVPALAMAQTVAAVERKDWAGKSGTQVPEGAWRDRLVPAPAAA